MSTELDVINEVLAYEAGRFDRKIYERTVVSSPILSMVKEDEWPEGMGSSVNVLTPSRMLPADPTTRDVKTPTWADVTFSADDPDGYFGGSAGTGTGGACIPPLTTVPYGFGLKSFNLEHAAIESPFLCVNDLRSSFETTQQINAMVHGLTDVTKWTMTQKIREFFRETCTRQILITANQGMVSGTTMPTPTGSANRLTMGTLLTIYTRLVRAGADNGSIPRDDGAPVFPLLIGMEQSRILKQENGIRDDFRWNPALVPELLKALGSMGSPVNGFQFINEIDPDRWNYTNGEWVWVPPYTYELDSGSNKYVQVDNPDYETATWEDTYVFHPDVFHLVFPGSISSEGGGTQFNPVNYRGKWEWINIRERGRNTDGTIGNFRGVFMLAGKPVYTDFGAVIRHARCNLVPQYAACPTS